MLGPGHLGSRSAGVTLCSVRPLSRPQFPLPPAPSIYWGCSPRGSVQLPVTQGWDQRHLRDAHSSRSQVAWQIPPPASPGQLPANLPPSAGNSRSAQRILSIPSSQLNNPVVPPASPSPTGHTGTASEALAIPRNRFLFYSTCDHSYPKLQRLGRGGHNPGAADFCSQHPSLMPCIVFGGEFKGWGNHCTHQDSGAPQLGKWQAVPSRCISISTWQQSRLRQQQATRVSPTAGCSRCQLLTLTQNGERKPASRCLRG